MVKRWVKKAGIYTASVIALLSGVSSYGLHELDKINAREFSDSVVVLHGRQIPIQEFYEQMTYQNNHWVYQDKETHKNLVVTSISDFEILNKTRARKWLKAKERRHTRIDTVYYYVKNSKWKFKSTDNCMYQIGSRDSLPDRPSLGICGYEEMVIRHFVPKDGVYRQSEEIFNDAYNCTSVHEEGHFEHKGPGENINQPANVGQIGQSYELTFVETCLDEISANIKQLIAQRQKYLHKGKDLRQITPRFEFYAQAIKDGEISPEPDKKMTEAEKEFIANSVFDYWMKDKYNIYREKNMQRTMDIHSSAYSNYNSVQEDTLRHRRVVKHMFTVNQLNLSSYGIDSFPDDFFPMDFSPYIFKREKEILEKITPEQKTIFADKVAEKKAQMTHLDKLEQIRLEQGKKAFDEAIKRRNKLVKINKVVARMKNFFRD